MGFYEIPAAIHPNRDGAIYRATGYYLFLIQLVIIAIQSSLYCKISCTMRCYILETPWTYQRVHKAGVGANKNIEMK